MIVIIIIELIVLIVLGFLGHYVYNNFRKAAAARELADMSLKQAEMKRALEARRLDLDKEGEDYEKAYKEFVDRYGAGPTTPSSKSDSPTK